MSNNLITLGFVEQLINKPEIIYKRNCPKCNREITYNHTKRPKNNCRNAIKKNIVCKDCKILAFATRKRKRGKENKNWRGYYDISGRYFWGIKNGAKNRNIECDITIEDAWNQFQNQNGECVYTGIKLQFNTIGQRGNASLDRINSTKGYTIGNIQWVHKDINHMKCNYNEEYFIEMCNKVAKYKG